jgi:hypothetical protein
MSRLTCSLAVDVDVDAGDDKEDYAPADSDDVPVE